MSGARSLAKNKNLLVELVKVNLTAQYKKSILGAAWVVLFPLFNIIIWLLLHGLGVFQPGETGAPYPVYLVLGMSLWFVFIGCYQAASQVIQHGGRLFLQANFPHEVFLASKLIVHLINSFIPIIITLIVMLLYGEVPAWPIVFLPLMLLPIIFLGTAIGLFLSVLYVVAVDAFNVFSKLMESVLYITPIIYMMPANDTAFSGVILNNPLTYLIGSVRDVVLSGRFDNPKAFAVWSAVSLVLFLVSLRFFRMAEPKVLEKLAI